ncbi:hypothetical protein ACIF6L_31775 [Kitasatospora sp. NPDC086009]|uniref:hypothetical protein n=1 Tax=unclassified Kitasatospora TaxID=2633591 RepID=UPI0037C5061E
MTVEDPVVQDQLVPNAAFEYVATQETLDRAERARQELAASGWEVWVETKWWKFEIHLNEQAANDAAEIAEHVGAVVAAFLPKGIAELSEAFVKLRAEWIRRTAAGSSCKLVSPWTYSAAPPR